METQRSRRHHRSSSSDSGSKKRRKSFSLETVTDEDIAIYLAKRAKRKALEAAKSLKISQTGYSNDGNPFGDPNLNETFVWMKKIERDVSQGVQLDAFSLRAEKKRQKQRMEEIERVKRRREERAIERAQREEDARLLALDRSRADIEDWEKQEEEFQFNQIKAKSQIRIREGRLIPIDVLSSLIDEETNPSSIELNDPCMVFKGLNVSELEQLRENIRTHIVFDGSNPRRIAYWDALLVVCDWEITGIRKKALKKLVDQERGMHSSVETAVIDILKGKSYKELEELQLQIESDMSSGAAKEVEFWEALLRRLPVYKAKARLNEIHTRMPRKFVPEQCLKSDDDKQEQCLENDDDTGGDAVSGPNNEINLDEKYQPRKPKYLNKVHTGYEWNKYNQTHYDHDNPPPKVVQGYKFNIFYPDILDKTKAPTYSIEEDGEESDDTCIIRFHGGPPYEDIAFRIVNKEWEYSRKKGFKCTFERGILRLYFNLKRYRYRR